MKPPPKRHEPLAGGSRREANYDDRLPRHHTATPRRFAVVVRTLDRTVPWGAFTDREAALRTVSQLRKWGFDGRLIDTQAAP